MKKTFERKEVKYLLNEAQYEQLRFLTKGKLCDDDYGLHTILSLYYDSPNFQMIQKSLSKPDFKEKFRIRSYGKPTTKTPVFYEIKRKISGVVHKRRIAAPLEQPLPDSQMTLEIDYLKKRYQLEPKVVISYDRVATFGCDDPDFRVTFDRNIRYRTQDLTLLAGDYGQVIAPEITMLMEVKALGGYPLWFTSALTALPLQRASFSKYAETYKRHLKQKPIDLKETIAYGFSA